MGLEVICYIFLDADKNYFNEKWHNSRFIISNKHYYWILIDKLSSQWMKVRMPTFFLLLKHLIVEHALFKATFVSLVW